MTGMMSKVAFASKISILMKTTSDDPNPTAGYLYGEVSKITYESVEYCEHMIEFLLGRLKKNSLNVKLKSLLVIRNVLEKSSVEFTRSLRKQSQEIKEMKSFSGPPDPLLGDSVYVQIRKTASEILEILFDTDRSASVSTPNDNVAHVSPPPCMEGFGNSIQSTEETGIFKSIIGKIKETVPQIKDATAYMNPVQNSNNNYGSNNYDLRNSDKTDQDYTSFGNTGKSTPFRPSDTFFGAGDASHCKTEAINIGNQQQNTPSNWLTAMKSGTLASQPQKYQIDLHENEKRLVEKLVIPEGIRSQPTTQDMFEFLQKCEALDHEVVTKLLSDKLSHQDTRIRLRTMFIIEGLIQSKLPNIRNLVRDNCESVLNTFLTSSHIASREKADKVLKLLKNDVLKLEPVMSDNYLGKPVTSLDTSLRQQQQEDVFNGLQINDKPNFQVELQGCPKTSSEKGNDLFNIEAVSTKLDKSNLVDLDLDPFSSLTQVRTTNVSSNNSNMNSGLLFSTPFTESSNFQNMGVKSENKYNQGGSSATLLGNKTKETSSIASSDLFDGLQTNPHLWINTPTASKSQCVSDTKDTNIFSQTDINSFDLLSPSLPALNSLQAKTIPANQFQVASQPFCNFTGYNNNTTGSIQPQNMLPVRNSRPLMQMSTSPHNLTPVAFPTQHRPSNISQFQNNPGSNPMRYHSPINMQPNTHVNSPNSSFNFLSQKSSEGRTSNDSFSFVQDAMKASIKK